MNTITTLVDILQFASDTFPQHTAIEFDNEIMTYSELCKKAKNFALQLTCFRDDISIPIIICLPKLVEAYISIYAVLFSGNYYIPVEYNKSSKLINHIIEDVGAFLIISTVIKLKLCKYNLKYDFSVSIEDNDVVFGKKEGNNVYVTLFRNMSDVLTINEVLPYVGSEYYAYILYSSGSSGSPKGIIHSHASSISFIKWAVDFLQLTDRERIAQFSEFSFDLSIFDIFATAYSGATLVPVKNLFGNVAKISKFILDRDITIWYSIPSVLLRTAVKASWRYLKNSKLKHLIFAGEKISYNLFREMNKDLSFQTKCHNWYGPTETNVCTFSEIDRYKKDKCQGINIGKPCYFCEVKVIRDDINIDAEEGELYVTGESLMQGYLRKESCDRRDFVLIDYKLYYPTGDLVKKDLKGDLLFIGRKDKQVQLDGYCINLEIFENLLMENEGILEVVILLIENSNHRDQIGIICTVLDFSISENTVYQYCMRCFPYYMIPNVIIIAESLPRNERGKLDRDAIKKILIEKSKNIYNKEIYKNILNV